MMSGVPKIAWVTPSPPAWPPKPRKIGTPLAIVEMPESCQPFSTPRMTGLSSAPRAPSGRKAFHDRLKMCVRSSGSTP